MVECPACGKQLSPPTVKCSGCGVELHRACARRTTGKWYCKDCYKKGKREARFEHMAQRASIFGAKKPGKVW
ncbi:MAG: hypothetical protein QMC89_02065 [Candidatus Hodarchaeaceae archaeon]|nr:hypothetical protein [Candidatus Hodarchaeaceae archaeon]